MLECRGLLVFYENALAVNELSLQIDRGQLVGVFGPNGAGKTTLLATLAGLTAHLRDRERRRGGLRVTLRGSVTFEGERIDHLMPRERAARGVILCRERHPLFGECTVEENLRLGGYLRPRREVAASIDEVLAIFPPLVALRRRGAGMLSGGEKEMVAIGMALVARPRLLLLDEPLLGLSPAMQAQVVKSLRAIKDRGVTILVSEQYARPLLPFVDRAHVLESGALVKSGTGAELLGDPEVKAAYFGA